LYVQRFIDPIRSLSLQYTNLQRATAGGVRIFEVLDTKADIVDAPGAEVLPSVQGEIKFDHVFFHYLPGIDVLKDVNLDIKPGETIAFVGSTGAGKSTFVSLVPRFYEISSGTIAVDGHDIQKITQESLRRQIGGFTGTVSLLCLYQRQYNVRKRQRYRRTDDRSSEGGRRP
jgi:ABC-type multidrug transport system fused ATPase/permease subunit